MFRWLLVLALLVSFANIALNYLAARTAASAGTWRAMFGTLSFATAFIVGTTSLTLLLTLYFFGKTSQFGMANGVLLMGATSILGGTFFGYCILGNQIHWSEWTILVLILMFLLIRYFVRAA